MANNKIEYRDYSRKVLSKMDNIVTEWLYEAAGELQSRVKRNCDGGADSGQTKGKWDYHVDTVYKEATVGNPLQNAIWEEFGTGQYALEGKGRQTPWYVPVEGYSGNKKPTYNGKVVVVQGKNGKKFYKTNGKRPRRPFWKAYESCKDVLPRGLQTKIKELSK